MNNFQIAEQMRRVLTWFAQTLDEEKALEVSCAYEEWKPDKAYKASEYVTYGKNNVGDPQLYKVVQDHISQTDWIPDITSSLYTPLGITKKGYPIWSQPTGAHDAYNIGDIVDYNGVLYKSVIDGNVYSPEVYPQGWEVYTETETTESVKNVENPEGTDNNLDDVLSGLI